MTSVEEFNCILCKETFDNKDELQTHFRKHGDPKFNDSLKNQVTNEKSNDAAESVNCDVCEEMFPTISKAITHKHKMHPEHDAKYFCPWCGKLFTMKHLYNKHIQTNHDGVDETSESHDNHFHCDCCSVYFYVSSAMIYHNKFFHRQDTDLPIIGHSKKQKLLNQDLLPLYYCSFCGDEYINKVNLHKHICDDHGDENQRPTDVLRCPLCEAIFYHLDAYELHLTFHSSNDLYTETNDMNESELSEYSLETVPPSLERIEDLNNLPDVETDVNAIGIESFLQMAMDEPDNGQRSKKVKSKKHKKHKKSKKSAITFDEFLNMNQDVFGEGLDFQGVQVQEVPTKVIKRQLISRKPQIQKPGVKFVSSTDLQKLQKAGIVVKMKSGSKPPSLHAKHIGQPVKVNPQVKNVTNQTQKKSINASDEVLSKLMNQSSNQLKIVKKSAQEKSNSDEPIVNELLENTKSQQHIKELAIVKNVEMDTAVENLKHENTDLKTTNPNVLEHGNDEEKDVNDCVDKETSKCASPNSVETENLVNITSQSNDDTTNLKTIITKSPCGIVNSTSGGDLKNTLKNISKHITIKSVTSPATKPQHDFDNPVSPKSNTSNETTQEDHCNKDDNSSNKKPESLRNVNSGIIIKSEKNGSILIDTKYSTILNDNMESDVSNVNISDNFQGSSSKIEKPYVPEMDARNNDKIKASSSPEVLKNLSKNITVKSTSPFLNPQKENNLYNKEPDDSVSDEFDDTLIDNKDVQKVATTIQSATASNVLKNLSKNITIKSMSPSVKHLKDNTKSKEHNSEFDAYDENPADNVNPQNRDVQDCPSSNVLKNLRKNIVVKSMSSSLKQSKIENANNEGRDTEFNDDNAVPIDKSNTQKSAIPNFSVPMATSHVLRNLNKNITIKSTSQSVRLKEDNIQRAEEASEFDEFDEYDEHPIANQNIKKVASLGLSKNASPQAKLNPDARQQPLSNLNSNDVQPEVKKENSCNQFTNVNKNSNMNSASNLLKNLKNITAKPVTTSKKSPQITATSSNTKLNIAKGSSCTLKSIQKKETTEEIETFNIDDSDSDDGRQQMEEIKTAPKKIEPIKKEVKPNVAINAIKNMSKQITVKCNSGTKQRKSCENIDRDVSDDLWDDEIDDDVNQKYNDSFDGKPKSASNKVPATTYKATEKEESFKQVFKNLGKHITVKSKTSSLQTMQHAARETSLRQNIHTASDESDEDHVSGKVKITEMTEDNDDDDIDNLENKGIVTQFSEGDSDDDHFLEDLDEFEDYESQQETMNMASHNLKSPSAGLLQNISKNITVKSLNERINENAGRSSNITHLEKDKLVSKNKLSNKIFVRPPSNQNKSEIRHESATSRIQNSVHNKRMIGSSNSNQSTSPLVPESSGVVNTVNKEVKVKTFQSETVIEEVTTTITKTIRRVNQVNQQVYNASQKSTVPKIIQQKNTPRMTNQNQQTKSLQGTIVRQSAPGMLSPKIRQAVPYRPPVTATAIRSSNQLVPVRPNANIRLNSSPRMQIKNMPQQQKSVGKPLKIAPNAMNQIKRPTEDTSGPFSCFKKPKESLIPGSESAAGSSSDFHYTSNSQTSKFCSTAKIMKDNMVVSKTQMRSESMTQQQQMSRQGNISGMKIAQSKQVSQVERSETSASKRSALEAIEKLQKQGLLIKKPRAVEQDFESPNSDSEHDEEFQDEDE